MTGSSHNYMYVYPRPRFPNMGILHVTKKKVPEVLTRRLIDGLRVSRGDFSGGDIPLGHGE